MTVQAREFVHQLRAARNITVPVLAGTFELTPGQYYYRKKTGKGLDFDAVFLAVVSLDKEHSQLPLLPEQVAAFKNNYERLKNETPH